MKKFAVLVVIMICIACMGVSFAAESQKVSTKQKEVMVDRNSDGVADGVDIYNDSGKVIKRGYDTNNDMMVDRWETYDGNTGMPIVTESDKAFELR